MVFDIVRDEGWTLVLIMAVTFLAAGTVKGVIGLGMPLLSVPILASFFPPATAISLMVAPTLSSNVWQAVQSGHQFECLRRFRVLLATMVVGSVIGAQALATVDPKPISVFLGVIVVVFVITRVFPVIRFEVGPERERFWSPIVGFVAGAVGGISNFFGPVLVMWLVTLKLTKDVMVSALGLFFLIGMALMYAVLAANGILTWRELGVSVLGVIPVFVGLRFGRAIRDRIPQQIFERVFLALVFVIGLNLIRRGLL